MRSNKRRTAPTAEGALKTAFVYARYSSERQTEQSIEGQIHVCNDYAERNNIQILDYYIDRAMTGTNDNRKDFQRMLKTCASRPCDYILVYKLDRFSRNKYEMAIHRKTLKDYGIKILSAMENIPDSPEGIILESLLEGMAEYYSVELAQKVKRGQAESLLKGHWVGGQVPYGYIAVDKKLQIEEREAEIVRYIYQQYADGVIVKDIIAELTARGIYNKGKPFTRNTIYYMLANVKYSGAFYFNDVCYDNICPRIVPDFLFQRVQRIIEKNKFGKKSLDAPYLLKGKVFCGYCGRTMNAECGTGYSGGIKRYYKCGGRKQSSGCLKSTIRKEDLEKAVIETTLQSLTPQNLELIADAIMVAHQRLSKDNSVLSLLNEEQQKIQKAINNILNAIEQGIVTPSTQARLQELEEKAEEIKAAIAMEEYKKGQELTRDTVLGYIKGAIKKSPQIMLDLLIRKIVLYNDKIEIYYNYTKDNDPDTDAGVFCIHGIVEDLWQKKRNEANLTVRLIPTWLLLSDSN